MIDLTKPLQVVSDFSEKPTPAEYVMGNGFYATVRLKSGDASIFATFALSTGEAANPFARSRLENVPPKMVKKTVTIFTAVMLSKPGNIHTITHVDDPGNRHTSVVNASIPAGSTLLKSMKTEVEVEVPEEFSGL